MGLTSDNTIRNVALVGAAGNLGSEILKALHAVDQFNLTVLVREPSFADGRLPVSVKVIDYDNPGCIVKALEGQDAVVSAVSRDAIPLQARLVEAAVTAGVKRFIPSEFGANLQNPQTRQLINNKEKVRVEELLEHYARLGRMTYTFIYNNVFLDWGMRSGLILDPKGATVNLFDGGARQVSMSRVPTVAKAGANVLLHAEETTNRSIYIHEATVSQLELYSIAREIFPKKEWKATVVDTEELQEKALAQMRSGIPNMSVFHAFAVRGGFAEGFGNQFGDQDNTLVGIQPMSAADIQHLIRAVAVY
ncbi:hypothetical protein ACJ41O_006715 [Fusarium nematophilum]